MPERTTCREGFPRTTMGSSGGIVAAILILEEFSMSKVKTIICAALLTGFVSSQAFAFSIGSGNGNGNGNVGIGNGNANGNFNIGVGNGNGNGNGNVNQ